MTTSYTYDGTQVDRLTSFGGKAITYDANGCVKTYDGWTYTWTKGKLTKRVRGTRLSGIDTYTYTYDAYGRRTSKNYSFMKGTQVLAVYITSASTTYTYDNSGRLIREQYTEIFNDFSSNSREIIYLYDENGVIGVMYSYNGSTSAAYFYRRNLQGDVTAIYDREGNRVGEYAYDAWGNCTILYGASNDLVSNNPIRYRGYYFDAESGFYFLNARYYNPQWRRFISPDSTDYLDPETPNGLNLYVYCNNDPVNYADPSGHAFISVLIGLGIAALIGSGIGAGSYTVGQVIDFAVTGSFEWSWGGFLGSTLGGAIGGMIAYALPYVGIGSAAFGAFFSGAATTAGTMIGQNITDNAGYSFMDILLSSTITGGFAALSVGIMSRIRITGLNAGRGSFSAISNQMYTKFRNQTISRITIRTFGKMLVSEAYSGIAASVFEDLYDYSGTSNWVLGWF